jgi:hypothetical protein
VEFEEEDEEAEGDENSVQYSEDFENSQLNTSSTSYKRNPFSPKVTISVPHSNRANNNNKNPAWKSLPKVSEEEPAMNTRKSTATTSGNMDSIVSNDIMELLRKESRAAFRPPELTSDPFADSIAKSFLASQVKSLHISLLNCFNNYFHFFFPFRNYCEPNWIHSNYDYK